MSSSRDAVADVASNPDDDPVLAAARAALRAAHSADLPVDQRIAVAFSGGLDSTVLLDAVARVAGASRCVAFHIHHGLSPNADGWLDHARSVAQRIGVAFDARRVDLSGYAGIGVEAAARDARYAALFALCRENGASVLVLGHHADDQAETFLIQALRGAGLRGLASMPVGVDARADASADVRADARADMHEPRLRMLRPLLSLPRAVLLDYARQRGLEWIDDESNDDLRYARNALRHAVLAPLAEHFPAYREGLARSARHAADAQALLDEIAATDLRTLIDDDGEAISIGAWRALDASSPRRAVNALRYWIDRTGLRAMSVARFDDLILKLRTSGDDRPVSFVHEGRVLRRYRDRLSWEAGANTAVSRDDPNAAGDAFAWTGQEVWHLPRWSGSLVFVPTVFSDPERISGAQLRGESLHAYQRRGGERMRAHADRPSRSLKNLFQEAGLPEWRRQVPLIFLGNELIFVPGLGLNRSAIDLSSENAAVADRSDWRRLEWRPDLSIC